MKTDTVIPSQVWGWGRMSMVCWSKLQGTSYGKYGVMWQHMLMPPYRLQYIFGHLILTQCLGSWCCQLLWQVS